MAAATDQTQGAARLDLDEDRRISYWRTLVRLLGYARPYRGKIALALAAMLAYSGTMMALPWTVKLAIDGQVMSDDGSFAGLAAAVGLFCLVALLRLATGVVHSRVLVRVGESLILDIRTRLFEHIQALSMSFYDRNQAGRVMSRVQNDTMELSQALFAVLAFALADLFSVVGIAIAMLLMDATLAAITLGMVALLIPSLVFWRRFAQPHLRRARVTVAGVNSGIQENVAGIRVVQSLNRQRHNASTFGAVNKENLDAALKSARYRYGLWPSVELLAVIAMAIVIYVGGRMIGTSLEVGLLVAFALYIDRLFEPIRDLTGEFGQLTGSLVAADRVFELLDVAPDVATAPDAIALPPVTGRVKYENVSFHYAPESPVLRDISLDVEPGETVALVGPTGAGKTTLVSLLMRLYDVAEGRITIDGHDVRDVRPDSLSRQISAVPQEPLPVLRDRAREHPVQPDRLDRRRGGGGREGRRSARIHRPHEGRLRHRAGGAGRQPEHGSAPAHQLRPGPRQESAHPDSRRGNGERGHGDGVADPAGPGEPDGGPHVFRDRPPAVDDPERGPHSGTGPRAHCGAGHSFGAAGEVRALLRAALAIGDL